MRLLCVYINITELEVHVLMELNKYQWQENGIAYMFFSDPFALSVLESSRKTKHYKVIKTQDGKLYIQNQWCFEHISKLVEHYGGEGMLVLFLVAI